MDKKGKPSVLGQLAEEYFATKVRLLNYELTALDEDTLSEVCFYETFSEEEIQLLLSLRERYGQDEFVKHLDEIFTDPDELYDLSCGREILSIDLDKPYYTYEFGCHELVDGDLCKHTVRVLMDDLQYIKALSLLLSDSGMNFNKLQFADSSLYDLINNQIVRSFCDDGFYFGSHPFLITFDELQRDADEIRKQHPELKKDTGIGYYCNI